MRCQERSGLRNTRRGVGVGVTVSSRIPVLCVPNLGESAQVDDAFGCHPSGAQMSIKTFESQ